MSNSSEPRILKIVARYVSFCCLLAIAFGLVTLAGWAFHLQLLKSLVPGQVAVKANTGACFVLLGVALWLVSRGRPSSRSRVVAQLLALIVNVVGLLSFFEFWKGWDLSIDQLLFRAGPEDLPGSVRPGLMSPITALDFFLLGGAVLFLEAARNLLRRLVQVLAGIAGIASISGILDFVLDPQRSHVHIAPMTAFVLFLLSFAVLLSRTELGFGALIASPTSGGELARRMLPTAFIVPVFIGWLRWRGQIAGLYGEWGGLVIMVLTGVTLLAGVTVWTGFVIDRADRERQRAEAASKRERERFEAVLDKLPVMICLLTPNYDVAFANQAFRKQFGESQGRKCFDYCFGRSSPCEFCETFQVLKTSAPHDWEVTAANGLRLHAFDFPFTDTDGSPLILEMDLDVTEQRAGENKLREQAALLELADDAIFVRDMDSRIVFWNRGAAALYGWSAAETTGKISYGLLKTEFPQPLEEIEDIVQQTRGWEGELVQTSRGGKQIVVAARWSLLCDDKGRPTAILEINRDITERKRAEQALQVERQRFRDVLDKLPVYVVLLTPDYHVALDNSVFRERFGESNGRRCYEFLFNRDTPCEICDTYNVLKDGKPHQWKWTGPDGRHYDIFDFPFTDSDGSPLILEMGTDVTERERAEEEIRKLNRELEERVEQRTAQLRESEQSVRRKLDSILTPEADLGNLQLADILDIPAIQKLLEDFQSVVHVTTALIDLDGKILAVAGWQKICSQFHRVNLESCKSCIESDKQLSTGIPEGEFKIYKCKNHMWDVATPIMIGGQHLGNLFCGQFFFENEPIDYEVFRAQAKQYGFSEKEYIAALDAVPRLSREAVNASMAFLARLAKVISQLSYSSIKLARSSTQLSRANAELEASVNELEAFTYSVSHDLRAPLRHISGFSKILSEEFAAALPEEGRHHLQRIEEGTQRMGLLVDDLLNLARVGRRDLDLRVTGLRSVLDEAMADLKPELQGRKIEWKIGELPFVECDPGLMKQVFQNLLSNAVKFTGPRAHPIIEIGQQERDGGAVICVRDNGVGFSMKYANKLFGVFQRLHRSEDFEGTGVGLATVQRIIQKHGGRIWAEAEIDKGATFYFTLAASEKREARAAAAGQKT